MDNSSEYISLEEATRLCSYSQEYLSLRARQGKLKSVKFGRNWVTKKEWLEEYVRKAEEYKNNKNHSQRFVSPPKNLPIEKTLVLRFGFITALALVLLIAGMFYGRESFRVVYQDLNPTVIGLNQNFDKRMAGLARDVSSCTYIFGGGGDVVVENTIEVLADTFSSAPQSFATVSLAVVDIGDILKEYSQWVSSQIFGAGEKFVQGYIVANDFIEEKLSEDWEKLVIGTKCLKQSLKLGIDRAGRNFTYNYLVVNDFVERKISQVYKLVTQPWQAPEKIVEEELIPKPSEEGLILIPSTEKDEEVKEKIEVVFSDEVKVEPTDKTSGIITPIFKDGEGQKYLYILVPVSYEQ
jgi:hypothetical protein